MLNRPVKRIGFLVSLILGSSLILANDSSVSSMATKAPTHFAVISDIPYNDAEYAALEHPDGVIAKAIKALDPPLLIHLGVLSWLGRVVPTSYLKTAIGKLHSCIHTEPSTRRETMIGLIVID